MLTGLTDWLPGVFGRTSTVTEEQVTDLLDELRTALGHQPVVRVYVERAQGRGHQAAALHLLARLFAPADAAVPGLAYRGTAEACYEGDETAVKLRQLMGWQPGQDEGLYKGGRVNLRAWSAEAPPEQAVTVALSAASDHRVTAAQLNADYHLRVQPFQRVYPNELLTRGVAPGEDLTQQPGSGGQGFHERGIRMPVTPIDDFDWAPYTNSPDAGLREKARALETIVGLAYGGGGSAPELLTTYGIHTQTEDLSAISVWPYDQVALLTAGALATQVAPDGTERAGARPVIIVNLDQFTVDGTETGGSAQDRFAPVVRLLRGDATQFEKTQMGLTGAATPQQLTQAQRRYLDVRAARERYLVRDVRAADRARFTSNLGEAFAEDLAWLQSDTGNGGRPIPSRRKVLWVQVGPVPPELFTHIMHASTLPPFFEGANTTNLAVNFGTMYYRLSRERVPYPTTTLDPRPSASYLIALQQAALQIGYGLQSWPLEADPRKLPPEVFARPILAYRAEDANGTYHSYFTGVTDFFGRPHNDKFNLAFCFLTQRLLTGARRAEATAEGTVLEDLKDALKAAMKDHTLTLWSSDFTGRWRKALADEDRLEISPVTLTFEGDPLTKITVTGSSDAFPPGAVLTLEFTAPDGKLETRISWTWRTYGALPGLDWIRVGDPTATLTVSEGWKLTGGELRATVSVDGNLTADLRLAYPSPSGTWLLTADFTSSKPTASRFFNLVGGLDLARLPAPFTALTSLAVETVGLAYDAKKRTAESLTLTTAGTGKVPLTPGVDLDGVTVAITVSAPASLTDRTVATRFAGKFGIKKQDSDKAVVAVTAATPRLLLSGELESGTLKLGDVLRLFDGITEPTLDQPEITAFSFSYDQTGKTVAVSAATGGTVKVGDTFTINDITLTLTTVPGTRTEASIGGTLTLLPNSSAKLSLALTSSYATETGWTFEARQTGGTLKLDELAKEYLGWTIGAGLEIDGLYAKLASKSGSWELKGGTPKDKPWEVPFLDARIGATAAVAHDGQKKTCAVAADLTWQGISLTLDCHLEDKGGKTFTLAWKALQGKVTEGTDGDWTAELAFTETVTVGWLIEEMVSWLTGTRFGLEAPWNVLDDIKLSNLKLLYTFNKAKPENAGVGFQVDIDPIELGFARIDGIKVSYARNTAARKVEVSLTGSFPWNVGDTAKGGTGSLGPWDASKPGDAPTPPGQGGKYLDLRLLALGQHVTVEGLKEATTVQQAMEAMYKLKPTEPDQLPEVTFHADSDWLAGADFGVLRQDPKKEQAEGGTGAAVEPAAKAAPAPRDEKPSYLVTLQGVFNDPSLYGLRVALAGDAAKVFKGLDFQIMYRQLSKDLGVYEAQIALPDAMRHLSVGAYSLTLPVFGIAVYTNGDFLIDVGFPKNGDWTRSFSIEGIIPPGLPMLGSGGFYFGKLPESAAPKLPKASARGTFNPVVVFGFGLRVGFGKSVEYGVLKAGFSLTMFGILEGVVATWNPYQALPPSGGADSRAQLQTTNYFWLQGSVGIEGQLYGSVDFAVVKAQVNVDIKLYVQLTYEAYVSLAVSVVASVEVSASVKIDLWLVSITLHFSFSLHLKETFTLPNQGRAPWLADGQPAAEGLLAGPADRRLGDLRPLAAVGAWADGPAAHPRPVALVAYALAAEAAVPAVDWKRLAAVKDKVKLSGSLLAPLTMAADEYTPTDKGKQQAVCVALMTLDSVAPAALATPAEDDPDSSFELLCKRVLAWVVAATSGGSGELTYEQVCDAAVTGSRLDDLLDRVLVSSDDNPTPVPPDEIGTFLSRQFLLTVKGVTGNEQARGEARSATAFPVPPGLTFTLPSGTSYTLAGYNEISEAGLKQLREDFRALLVQVEAEQGKPMAAVAGTRSLSVASWVFADYVLLLARQMVQAARSGLRTFTYPLSEGTTAQNAIDWIAGKQGPRLTPYDVFAANPTHALSQGGTVTVGAVCTAGGGSFQSLADALPRTSGTTATAADLATANALAACLRPGEKIKVPGKPDYTVPDGGTLLAAAKALGLGLGELLSAAGLLDQTRLPAAGAKLLVPAVTRQAFAGDTFAGVAGGFPGVDAQALATANAGRGVLRAGTTITYRTRTHVVRPGDCLGDVANAVGCSFPDLWNSGAVDGTALQDATNLLAPLAVLAIPRFTVEPGPGDTLQAIAARFGSTLAVLGHHPANAAVTFASGQTATLALPHLTQLRLGTLMDEARRTRAFQHLSGMASRYQLHGLRLTTHGIITPKARGMWVTGSDGDLKLPDTAGLHALTGQQVAVPAKDPDQAVLKVSRPATGMDWLTFDDGQTSVDLPLAQGKRAQAVTKLTAWAKANALDVPGLRLGPAPVSRSVPARYPLTSQAVWQAMAPVTLPYGSGTPAGSGALRVCTLPDALLTLPDPVRLPGGPRMRGGLARYDEATGATSDTTVTEYAWASVIRFGVTRLPEDPVGKASSATYQITGASGADLLLLERLADRARQDSAYHQVVVGYPPSATGAAADGLQTGDPAGVTTGIAQVDLSTTTRPGGMRALAAAERPAAGTGLLNGPAELVRLLWEASITRNGGFFLYYYDTTTGGGLPDRIFDDRGQAELTLLVLHAKPEKADQQNRVTDYVNALVTAEPYEATHATLYAEADPPAGVSVPAGPKVSLRGVAESSYSDIGDLAEANAALRLREVTVRVSQGVYRVTGSVKVSDIVARFGTTLDKLKEANPRRGDLQPDTTLTCPDALRLPVLTPTGGIKDKTGTLAAMAAFYGTDLAALGADNAGVAGLFADGQAIAVTGGPVIRTAGVPQGAVAFRAERSVPASVPDNPDAQDFAKLYLLHNFTLLGYRIEKTVAFAASPAGAPAGPTVQRPHDGDKLRVLSAPADDGPWTYALTMPYPRFAEPLPSKQAAGPYSGVGDLLRTSFDWLDQFGNRLVTTLAEPQAPLGRPTVLTGYTDALIGLGQWPSISADWQVVTAAQKPVTQIGLSFDASRYSGLLKAEVVTGGAEAAGQTTVKATFTEAVETTSAEATANYAISAGTITRASVSGGTVSLTVQNAPDTGVLVLTARDIKPKDPGRQRDLGGTAAFDPTGRVTPSSTAQANAAADLLTYTRLLDQLTDPLGTSLTVSSTLVTDSQGQPVPQRLGATQVTGLLAWLRTIKDFLTGRAAFQTATEPVQDHTIALPVDTGSVNPDQLFRLSLSFTVARIGGVVPGGLATASGVREATTAVPPRHEQEQPGKQALGLTAFARSFQQALSDGDQLLKVAVGADRGSAGPGATTALWAVHVGVTKDKPVSYRLTQASARRPAVFAPRPAANRLQTRTVEIREYVSGTGLVDPPREREFTGVDMDVWCRALFTAVDGVLTPRYTAALQILARQPFNGEPRDWLGELLAAKRRLVEVAVPWMIPVYADQETLDPGTAREAYRQALLSRLSNAYATRAAVEYHADVVAAISDPLAELPPRLYGGMTPRKGKTEGVAEDSRTGALAPSSPKLTLQHDEKTTQPLAFVLSGPEVIHDNDGAVIGRATLNLDYTPTAIEHQIGPKLGATDYRPSSWLAFVTADGLDNLAAAPAQFDVPLPLRAFPDSPVLTVQTGEPDTPGGADGSTADDLIPARSLDELTRWRYAFSYTRPFHYPHDQVHLKAAFNLSQRAAGLAAPPHDPFAGLAQFTTVFPKVQSDLDTFLSKIDATAKPSSDPFLKAAVAVNALVTMVDAIAPEQRAIGTLTAAPPAPEDEGNPVYEFTLSESPEQVGTTPDALIVTVKDAPPAGIGVPVVLVAPDRYQAELLDPGQPEGPYRYAYKEKTAGGRVSDAPVYLTAEEGQAIPPRTVLLTGLDALALQDAKAAASLERNRDLVPNRPLADPFVYTTGQVSFPNPLHPYVDHDTPVDISTLGGTPTKALDTHFLTLLKALLYSGGKPKADQVTLRAEVTYRYPLNTALPAVPLPVLVQPPASVKTADADVRALCDRWAGAVREWFTAKTPLGGGNLGVDLTVVSDLTSAPMPLLRLRGLYLPIAAVNPPLPTQP